MTEARRSWRAAVLLGALIAVLQGLALLNPSIAEVDPEELYNASHAQQLISGHLGALFRMQYREFCGGCSLDALLAAPLLALGPDSWLTWKLVPIGFTTLLGVAGFAALRRQAGPAAAAFFALLVLLPPRSWLHLSLISWGNHVEAGVLGTCGLLAILPARARPVRLLIGGGLLGAALWVSFSGAWALAAAFVWLARRPRDLALVSAGAALGLLPWLGQWLTASAHPFVTIYQEGEALPSLSRLPHKLGTLLRPGQLVALFGLPHGPLGWAAGWGWAASLVVAAVAAVRSGPRPARGALVALACWTAIYAVVRFQVYDPDWPEIAVPGSTRYAAPVHPLAFLLVASVAGRWWSRRPRAALALMAMPLAAGLAARAETLQAPFPVLSMAHLTAGAPDTFRPQFSYALSLDEHEDCAAIDLRSQRLHAYAIGRESVAAILRARPDHPRPPLLLSSVVRPAHLPVQPFVEGVAEALLLDLSGRVDTAGELLARAELDLAHLPAVTEPQRQHALDWLAWRHLETWGPLRSLIDTHDAAALRAVAKTATPLSEAAQQAVWWSVGRRWALDVAGWHLPTTAALPTTPPGRPLPDRFVEGYGHGLGERWGPRAEIPRPSGLAAAQDPLLVAGYSAGQARRWRPAPDPTVR